VYEGHRVKVKVREQKRSILIPAMCNFNRQQHMEQMCEHHAVIGYGGPNGVTVIFIT